MAALQQSYSFEQWSSSAIHHVLTYVYECWKIRNNALHDPKSDEESTRLLHEHVRRLYLDPDRYLFSTREKRQLFNIPIERRLRFSNAILESWVDIVEMRLRLDREEYARRTLTRWLDDNKSSGVR